MAGYALRAGDVEICKWKGIVDTKLSWNHAVYERPVGVMNFEIRQNAM